ncbi:MAG: redox-regulated ATPase YchF, partial [Patescibacteria group bacterium]
ITNLEVNIANYPFATIDPNVGVVPVPDERLDKLTKLSGSKKTIPAVVEFYDIAGLVKGANAGEGLGNKFLSHIREVNAILQVVRVFRGGDIIHIEGGVDPVRDIEIIRTELILKDLDTVTKRLVKAEADARTGNKDMIRIKDELVSAKTELEKGGSLLGKKTGDLNLLTSKPTFFLLNGSVEDVDDKLKEKLKELNADYLVLDLAEVKQIPDLIKKAYEVLNLISFLTTGEDETRAWTIERGMKAPQAAGVIHTDFENKFIRAEVVNWTKLLEAGSWNGAKQKGWLRLEGKEYVVQDGDVMVIRHG